MPENLIKPHRPLWVEKLTTFLNNTIVDYLPDDGSEDLITDQVTEAAMAVVCKHFGHFVENDQCMKPVHRYCIICGKRMSDSPLGDFHE